MATEGSRGDLVSEAAIERRLHWTTEIVRISDTFGRDADRVEEELDEEIAANGPAAIVDHLRLCGAIPESYAHDSSEEKLYSKYTDILIAIAFRSLGLTSLVLTARADAADVEVIAPSFSFVADAKAFRLSRTAKNQKDFKVEAMDGWKLGKPYATVVCPLYQFPSRTSQIYQQAAARNVCLLSYSHLAVLVQAAIAVGRDRAVDILLNVFQVVETLNPSKDAVAYWSAINRSLLSSHKLIRGIWRDEKSASIEAISIAKTEALAVLARERETIARMSREEAIAQLLQASRIEKRIRVIESVSDNGLLDS